MFEQPPPNKAIEEILAAQDAVSRIYKHIDAHFLIGKRAREKPLLQHAQVSYIERFVEKGEPLDDALGRRLDLDLVGPRGVLLLIDPHPDANWGHLCWIAACDEGRQGVKISVVESSFPPREEFGKRLRTYVGLDAYLLQQ